jgi:alpha-L-arabinofuranosidase
VRDSTSGDVIIKLVNGDRATVTMTVEVAGLASGDLQATKTVLTGASAGTFNEDGQPSAVKPVASEVTLDSTFDYEAPANSLTVFRIRK